MRAKEKRREANMKLALAKLQKRIDRGEVDNPEERIEQIKRAFGEVLTSEQQNSSSKLD
jgi:hypothetical protein